MTKLGKDLLSKLRKLICIDTKAYELYSGFLCLIWGIGLALPDGHFPPGMIFSKTIYFTDSLHVDAELWAILFIICGTLRVWSLYVYSDTFRRILSLVLLYLWILVLYYSLEYTYTSIISASHLGLMAIFSVFSYLRLWRYRWT